MYKGLVNSPETTITNNISANDTIIYVLDPTRVPSDLPNLMVLGTGTNAETIKVTAIEGDALTVERGFQGIAKDWLEGTIIARNFTEYDYAALVDNINELELTKETPDGAQAKADTAEGNAKTYASDLIASHLAEIASHVKPARIVIGTSTAGWTAKDCNYLCDGTNDQEEIIQALNDLPATGGEVVILDGTYNITASINIPKDNVSLRGNGNATTLKRMYNSTDTDSGPTARGLITLNEKSGCKIQGLQIDGNKAIYTASYNNGIYLSSSSNNTVTGNTCLLYTSPSPRDRTRSRMPSSA